MRKILTMYVRECFLSNDNYLVNSPFNNKSDSNDTLMQVTHVLEGHAALTLRSRLRCILMKQEEELNKVSWNFSVRLP